MRSVTTKWYSRIAGILFLLLILIVFLFIPCPTNSQLNFFRFFIAISAGAFATTLPGTSKFNNKLISATSSIGVFSLVYLRNPANWNNSDDCRIKIFEGTVYLDGKLTQGIDI